MSPRAVARSCGGLNRAGRADAASGRGRPSSHTLKHLAARVATSRPAHTLRGDHAGCDVGAPHEPEVRESHLPEPRAGAPSQRARAPPYAAAKGAFPANPDTTQRRAQPNRCAHGSGRGGSAEIDLTVAE